MFKFRPTALPGFRVGLPEDDQLGFNVANDGSTLPVVPDAPDVSAVDGNYPFAATSPGFITPPALSPNPAAPLASGSLALPAMRESTASENLQPDPQGEGGGLTLARYDASDLPNRTDPAGVASDASQNAPSDDGFQLARSAQARAPQPPTDTSPGEAVVLPAGFEIGQSGMFGAPAPP